MTDEDVLPEKELIEKAARVNIKLTKQTDFVGKQYQGLDKIHEFDKKRFEWIINKTLKIPYMFVIFEC